MRLGCPGFLVRYWAKLVAALNFQDNSPCQRESSSDQSIQQLRIGQQQACLALHRMHVQMMKMRIMQTNALRGLLYEFGIVLPEGHKVLLQRISTELAIAHDILPSMMVDSVREQLFRVDQLQPERKLWRTTLLDELKHGEKSTQTPN